MDSSKGRGTKEVNMKQEDVFGINITLTGSAMEIDIIDYLTKTKMSVHNHEQSQGGPMSTLGLLRRVARKIREVHREPESNK